MPGHRAQVDADLARGESALRMRTGLDPVHAALVVQQDVVEALEGDVDAAADAGHIDVAMEEPRALEPERLARSDAGDALAGLGHILVVVEEQRRARDLDGVVGVDRLAVPLETAGLRALHAAELVGAPLEEVVAALGAPQVLRAQRRELGGGDLALHAQILAHRHLVAGRPGLEGGEAVARRHALCALRAVDPQEHMPTERGRLDARDRGRHPRMAVVGGELAAPVEVVLVGIVVGAGEQLRHDAQVALAGGGVLALGEGGLGHRRRGREADEGEEAVQPRAMDVHRGIMPRRGAVGEACSGKMVPGRGLEPPRCYPLVPETSASTNSATRAGRGRGMVAAPPILSTRHPTCAGRHASGTMPA